MKAELTCPHCKNEMVVPVRYLERKEREGEPVRCPVCYGVIDAQKGE